MASALGRIEGDDRIEQPWKKAEMARRASALRKKAMKEDKTRKIRVFPTHEPKQLLKRIGTVRWTYNRCVAAIRDEEGLARSLRQRGRASWYQTIEEGHAR